MINNSGPWLLALLCCGWPAVCSYLSIIAYRRYQRYGIAGFIPRQRSGGSGL